MSDAVHVLSDQNGNLFAIPHDLLEQAQVPPELSAKVQAAVGGGDPLDIQQAVPLISSWAAGKKPDGGDDGPKPPKDDLTQLATDLAAEKKPDDGSPPIPPPKLDAEELNLRSLGSVQLLAQPAAGVQ